MRLIGIDLGEKRTGLAISDQTALIACPLKTIKTESLIEELKEIVEREKIMDIVIGMPKNMNNTVGESGKKVLQLKEKLKEELKINIHLEDERRTTIVAGEYMIETNVKKRKKKERVDKIAAALILQNYLDRRNNNGKNDIQSN